MLALRKISIIDSDGINVFLIESIFKRLDLSREIEILNNALTGCEHLITCYNDKTPLPELVFFTYRMPVMDGIEMISKFKNEAPLIFDEVVFVMLSVYDEIEELDVLIASGVKEIISLPLTDEIVLTVLDKYFSPINN